MLRNLETSIFIKFLKILHRCHSYSMQWWDNLWQNSYSRHLIYRLIRRFWYKIKLCFKYSFLGKISETKDNGNMAILEKSKVLRFFVDLYKKWKHQIISSFRISKTDILMREFKHEFALLPIKTVGLVIVIAILTNIIISIFIKQKITLLGYFILALLLFAGFAGINSKAGWPVVKNSSTILKLFSRRCAGSAER